MIYDPARAAFELKRRIFESMTPEEQRLLTQRSIFSRSWLSICSNAQSLYASLPR